MCFVSLSALIDHRRGCRDTTCLLINTVFALYTIAVQLTREGEKRQCLRYFESIGRCHRRGADI